MTNETTASQPNEPHWIDGEQSSLGGKTAREGYAANPEYAGLYPAASQPKSIGDDAQFQARLADLYSARDESIELGISAPDDRAIAKLIDCIDSFRAPAAQASATIQAAPEGILTADDEKLLRNIGDQPYGEDDHGRGRTLSIMAADVIRRLAATIQEPVMVAEPVEKAATKLCGRLLCLPQVRDGNNIYVTASAVNACVKEFLDKAPAAPMVADPAGVALTKYNECMKDDIEPDALERLRFFCSFAMSGPDWLDSEKFFDDVAATVKSVPSEALDEPDMLWLYDDGEVFANGPDEFAKDYADDAMMAGDEVEVMVDCAYRAERRTMRIKVTVPDDDRKVSWEWVAAPLADKTGGGE